MGQEIERKYLVNIPKWQQIVKPTEWTKKCRVLEEVPIAKRVLRAAG